MTQIVIQEVNSEFVPKKGKSGYTKLSVTYTDGGKNFTKQIVSFSNPSVYEALKDAKQGDIFEVEVKKEGEYWQWTSAKRSSKDSDVASPKQGVIGARSATSWETPEERAKKQVLIVKQSCLAQAVAYHTGRIHANRDEVLETAQVFVDWVMGNDEAVAPVDGEDIPY